MLQFYKPELTVVFLMVLLLFLEAFTGREKNNKLFVNLMISALLLVAATFLLDMIHVPFRFLFQGAVIVDSFGTLIKVVMILAALGTIHLSQNSSEIPKDLKNEFGILAVGVLVGGMVMVSATTFLTVYIGLETMSIISYAMASLNKSNELSSEAGLKYVLFGGLASGVMLFGMSHLYGFTGTINYVEMIAHLKQLSVQDLFILIPSLIMFFVGFAYKISAVPFHMWTPDVYEGSPTPVTAFFSIVPKIAALGALFRFSTVLMDSTGSANPSALEISWVFLLIVVSALTMTVGNVTAIGQRSVKRMLAYSSISHAGFMLMAVLVLDDIGARSLVFYMIAYLFMNLIAFSVTSYVTDEYGNDHFDRFSGLIKKHPIMAITMTITMLSLAGLPPFAGFVAKFNIFAAIINKKLYGLAIIAGLNSVVSLYYYIKVIRIMVFKDVENEQNVVGFTRVNQAVVMLFTFPVLFLGIYWEQILAISNEAKIYFMK